MSIKTYKMGYIFIVFKDHCRFSKREIQNQNEGMQAGVQKVSVEGCGGMGVGIDGVNMPAYKDWANIQFVLPRLSSTVAATQFLPIDLPATGTITLHQRHDGPRIRSSKQC